MKQASGKWNWRNLIYIYIYILFVSCNFSYYYSDEKSKNFGNMGLVVLKSYQHELSFFFQYNNKRNCPFIIIIIIIEADTLELDAPILALRLLGKHQGLPSWSPSQLLLLLSLHPCKTHLKKSLLNGKVIFRNLTYPELNSTELIHY